MHVIVAHAVPVEAITTVRVVCLLAEWGAHGLCRPTIDVRPPQPDQLGLAL